MEGRGKLQIDTEIPSSVYALNLRTLSKLAKIPEVELVRGMQAENYVEMQGVVVEKGKEVPFEAVGRTPEDAPEEEVGVKEVLITAASSTMCLEGSDTPKCLIQLGEYTLIEHILAQLFVAGMERVVIIISHFGHEIMEHVKDSLLYHKMKIEFLNLGEETPYGHARTLLSAREMFTKPFLIHTADHIFDKTIIHRLASFDLGGSVACVLVDTDKQKLTGLPETAGKVELGPSNNIKRIGRGLKRFDAIDAGLFLTTGRIFAALEMLAYEKPKFSLAEALNVLRPTYGLKYLDTAGEVWLSIETNAQYEKIVEKDSISHLSPWPVFVAKDVASGPPGSALTSEKSVLLAVSATADDSTLRVASTKKNAGVFEGFVVGVNQLEEVPVDEEGSAVSEATPLLSVPSSPSGKKPTSPKHKIVRRKSSILETAEDAFVLSIPFQQLQPMGEESTAEDIVTPLPKERNAYLIELPQPSNRPRGESQQFVLAVPERETLYKRPGLIRQLSSLPTDVKEVAVEAMETKDGGLEVQLVVKRQVPLVGYVLLLASLLTISSLGAALDIQKGVDPFLKLFWRTTASLVAFLPLAGMNVYYDGLPKITSKNALLFLICCVSHTLFLMTFLWSLNHTTIGHAYIFNNCHSLIMVIGKLLLGSHVAHYEGVGTCVGILGGIITTIDPTTSSDSSITSPSLAGDLVALVGAVGGVFYLVTAKKLRVEIDVTLLLTGVFVVSGLLHFPIFSLLHVPYEFSTDPTIGLFGWLDSSRIVSETYIVLVCTLIGTLGYVSVMKYFDPIVVSVVMLLEPILATCMGVMVGVDSIPGLLTMAGSSLILVGTALVIMSNAKRVESINATDAMAASIMPPQKGMYSTRASVKTLNKL